MKWASIIYYDHSPRDVQTQVFRRQLALARAAKLPVVIHCRDAWDDCLAILERTGGQAASAEFFIVSPERSTKRGAEWTWDFMISFAGNVTYPKMQHLRDVSREIPLERLLTETDSPFLAAARTPRQAQRACLCG